MRQFQSLSFFSIVSLLPALVIAAPPADGSGGQGQSLDGATQSQGQSTQSQSTPPPAPAPGPYGPPTIQVNPQIQVQVNPDVDVEANPQSDADSKADANAEAQANPKADATADIDTEIKSEIDSSSTAPNVAPPSAPGEQQKVTKIKIVHKPVPEGPAPKQYKPPPRRSGLMIAGVFTFGASYIGTAFNAAYIYDNCHRATDESRCRQLSTKMFIPVAGPFMAIKESRSATNRVKLGFLGGVQTAGAAMAVVGGVMHIRDGRANRVIDHRGVRIGKNTRIAPTGGTAGGGMNLNMRF
jgi:hypothetical protein